MGSARHHVIDVRDSCKPVVLERAITIPPRVGGMNFVKWVGLQRGPVALEIEMPARVSLQPLVILLLSTVPALALGEVLIWQLATDTRWWVHLALFAFAIAFAMIIWLTAYAPLARRETLEVDSTVVALRRGAVYLAAWDRATFDDVRVTEPGRRCRLQGKYALGGEPTLAWGFHPNGVSCVGGAGSGISREAARELLGEIQAFIAAHPRDPDSERTLGSMSVRARTP